jgi:hypothetical protein
MEQYSPEWWRARVGIPTSSSADKIITPVGGDLSKQCDKYLNQLLADRAGFGDPPMEPTEWMARGTALEPEARRLFEFETGMDVTEVGFVTNDDGTAGASPDGLVKYKTLDMGFEVKCPKASTHYGYLRAGILPPHYKPQVHMSMAVTGIVDWHFMSYFPGLDPLIVLVHADEYTTKVSAAITEFTARLAEQSERFGLSHERKAA